MGVTNALALTAELTVLAWYVVVPVAHRDSVLLAQDYRMFSAFKQSLGATVALSLLRLAFFVYIHVASQRGPVTRCFVFFVCLAQGAICALSALQPCIYWRDSRSFHRYRVLPWGDMFVTTLWALAFTSVVLHVVYILRLNKSTERPADDRLMRDMLQTEGGSEHEAKLALWRTKWTQLVKHFKRKQSDPTFEAIVRLFAQRDNATDRLAVVYDRDPAAFAFYLPQLCSFLLLGAFTESPQLCVILLEKCGLSHVFAHKMLWYFQSFCVSNPSVASEEMDSRVRMLIDEVASRGSDPARAIDNPLFQPVEAGLTKQDYGTMNHSQDGEPLLSTKDERSFQGQAVDLERGGWANSDPFQLESTFLTALASISSNLRTVPMSQRNEMLRTWLEELETQYLPSNSLYLPVGNAHHRLKRIHVNESFTFSTRERVPYLLCAEVIDYTSPSAKKELPKRPSMFNRRFTLSLWDISTDSITPYPSAVSTDHVPPISPDSTPLGFWSESKPPSSPPRLRSISQHLSTSITNPSELFTGIIDTLVRKAPDSDDANRETLLANRERRHTDSAPGMNQNLLAQNSSEWKRGDSHATTDSSKRTLTTGTSSGDRDRASLNVPNNAWSPRSDGPTSPQSMSSAYSPPSLARCDSTDIFLRKLTERDSKLVEEDEYDVDPLPSSSRSEAPCVIFNERWEAKEGRIRVTSPWGQTPGWRLLPVIVKSDDDLRQEQLASQLIRQFHNVFVEAQLPVFIRPYDVIAISSNSGLVEAVADTISIDSLRRNDPEYTTLLDFFRRHFGDESTSEFREARSNFVKSMAAYSILCYLLQIKDRHNGNLLIDAEGHIIHIDFGFMLSNNPGNVAFEQAPFKLTSEFVELMGGPRSAAFRRFRSLCVRSFLVARKYRHRFVLLVEMMLNGNEHLPCFAGDARGTLERLAERFQPDLDIHACEDFVHELIDASLDNWRTKWYDKYQRWCVGVF